MAQVVPMFAIVINLASPEQRDQVHEIVKQHAHGWWHSFADLWIVGGKDAVEWRDLVGVAFATGPGGVLVLKVEAASSRTWAGKAAFHEAAIDWLQKFL